MKKSGIKSIDKVLEQIDSLESLFVLEPFFKMLGVDFEKIKAQFSETRATANRSVRLLTIFNPLFVDKGWIASEHSNLDELEKCIELGKSGDFEEAEQILISFYSPKWVEGRKFRFWSFESLKIRSKLIESAMLDYREKRYLACIPQILMIIDGFMNDEHPDQKGFFAAGHLIYHNDSISAQRDGLQKLYDSFNRKRGKTNNDMIRIPFRHGIMHGRDLNYGNEMVAAKCWSLLFALIDWRTKTKEKIETHPKEQKSLLELLSSYQEIRDESELYRKSVEGWEASITEFTPNEAGLDGEPSFPSGSAEKAVADFLHFWQNGNFGKMADLTHYLHEKKPPQSIGQKAGDIKSKLKDYDIEKGYVTRVEYESAALAEVNFLIVEIENEVEFCCRLIHVDLKKKAYPSTLPGGRWKIIDGTFSQVY